MKKDELKEENLNKELEDLIVEDESNPELKWYLVQTQSNCEQKAKQNIELAIELNKLDDKVSRVLNPAVKVFEMRNGKKHTVNKKLYPSYILIFAEMNDEVFHAVTKAPKVSGFLNKTSSSLLPRPVLKKEMENMFKKLNEYTSDSKNLYEISVHDVVRILDGPFKDLEGVITELDTKKGTAKVSISIFGKSTDISLKIKDVEVLKN